MLLSEVQYNNCKKKGCQCCLSIVSYVDERLSVANTTISRQYVECKRRRKRNSIENLWNDIANEKSQINCIKRCCCCCKLLTTDKMSFYSDEKKYQTEDQITKLQDRTFFLSSINQSFSIFYDNYLTVSSKRLSNTFRTSKTNQFRTNFKSSRFKLIQTAIFFIILASINCILAVEDPFNNLLNSIESQTTNPSENSISLITAISTNLSLSSNFTKSINSSTPSYSSLSYITNLLPSTKSFNYFYSSNQPKIDQPTTRLPIINKNFTFSQMNYIDTSSIKNNQTKSAHFNKNAFHQINFNQSDTHSFNKKWPYKSKFENFLKTNKFNWTDRFKKEILNSFWSSSASTESPKFTNDYSNLDFTFNDYDSNISQFIHLIPTPSALINQSSNQILSLNRTKILNENYKDLDNTSINETDFIDNLNITDNDSNFISDFLQPFTNLSWWNKIPFPQSGYHNYSIVFLAFFITIVMMVVVIGNLLVCIAICTEKSLKTIQNWFIASLAVSDLLLGLIIMPFSLAYELMGTWVFSNLWYV